MQAVIMAAHGDLSQVKETAKLLSEKFEVFIHVDKKTAGEEIEKSGLRDMAHVRVYSLYRVTWAGSGLLKAILYLMREALKNRDITYFHIISGEDFPVRSPEEIYNFFEGGVETRVWLRYRPYSEMDKKMKRFRYQHMQYCWLLDIFNYRYRFSQKMLVRALVMLQRICGVDRLKLFEIEPVQGLVWGDLPRGAVEYCLEYLHENPQFLEDISYGLSPDEYFFQPILYHSTEWKEKITNDNLRYMQWEKRNGSYPAVLDMRDLEKIEKGNYFFARKIRRPISDELTEHLKKWKSGSEKA